MVYNVRDLLSIFIMVYNGRVIMVLVVSFLRVVDHNIRDIELSWHITIGIYNICSIQWWRNAVVVAL